MTPRLAQPDQLLEVGDDFVEGKTCSILIDEAPMPDQACKLGRQGVLAGTVQLTARIVPGDHQLEICLDCAPDAPLADPAPPTSPWVRIPLRAATTATYPLSAEFTVLQPPSPSSSSVIPSASSVIPSATTPSSTRTTNPPVTPSASASASATATSATATTPSKTTSVPSPTLPPTRPTSTAAIPTTTPATSRPPTVPPSSAASSSFVVLPCTDGCPPPTNWSLVAAVGTGGGALMLAMGAGVYFLAKSRRLRLAGSTVAVRVSQQTASTARLVRDRRGRLHSISLRLSPGASTRAHVRKAR